MLFGLTLYWIDYTPSGNGTKSEDWIACKPKLTPESREYCRKNRLCFRCRRGGHLSINCPTFTNSFNSIRPSGPVSKK